MLVTTVSVLLGTLSLAAVTVTEFVTFPRTATPTRATRVTAAVSPGTREGIVTLAEALLVPGMRFVGAPPPMAKLPDTNVTPVGSVSTNAIDVAVEGPLFVTFMV